jgi:hypothetical protein
MARGRPRVRLTLLRRGKRFRPGALRWAFAIRVEGCLSGRGSRATVDRAGSRIGRRWRSVRMRGAARRGDRCSPGLQRRHGSTCESINGGPESRRVWGVRQRNRRGAQRRTVRHRRRVDGRGHAPGLLPLWGVLRSAPRAIAAVCAGLVGAVGGARFWGRKRSQDGRQRLVWGRRRCARAQRSLPILRLERRDPHCRRETRGGLGERAGGGAVGLVAGLAGARLRNGAARNGNASERERHVLAATATAKRRARRAEDERA